MDFAPKRNLNLSQVKSTLNYHSYFTERPSANQSPNTVINSLSTEPHSVFSRHLFLENLKSPSGVEKLKEKLKLKELLNRKQ